MKKGKLESQKLLKITKWIRALSTSWENMYSPKPGTWQLQHLYMKINSGFHARENPSEAIISESSQIRELHKIIES